MQKYTIEFDAEGQTKTLTGTTKKYFKTIKSLNKFTESKLVNAGHEKAARTKEYSIHLEEAQA